MSAGGGKIRAGPLQAAETYGQSLTAGDIAVKWVMGCRQQWVWCRDCSEGCIECWGDDGVQPQPLQAAVGVVQGLR